MNLKKWPRNPEYIVSDCGKVFRGGKERKLNKDYKGYTRLNVMLDGKAVSYKFHRMVLETFVGPCPEGMQTRHLNGDRSDNRLQNLQWGTPIENADDKKKHGTVIRLAGETNPSARLTEANVIEMRRRAAEGETAAELAKEFNIPSPAARDAINGRKWKHLPGALKRKPGPKKKVSVPQPVEGAVSKAE